jgi:anti-anti-sigma factor
MTSDSTSRQGHATPSVARFTCSLEALGGSAVLSLRGEMDLAAVERFEQVANAALATGSEHVVADLSELQFLDSTGIRALLRLQARVGDRARLELVPGPPAVQRVFELVGLAAALPFRR